jgi:hypothetical protein
MTMEFRERFPTMKDLSAWEADNRRLEQVGFSREQIAGIVRVKALCQRGIYSEANPEHKRQAFIRWLYLQGRLQS